MIGSILHRRSPAAAAVLRGSRQPIRASQHFTVRMERCTVSSKLYNGFYLTAPRETNGTICLDLFTMSPTCLLGDALASPGKGQKHRVNTLLFASLPGGMVLIDDRICFGKSLFVFIYSWTQEWASSSFPRGVNHFTFLQKFSPLLFLLGDLQSSVHDDRVS